MFSTFGSLTGAPRKGGAPKTRFSPACPADQAPRAAAASNEEVQIIANTPQQQAVYHKRLDLLAVAFWKAGRARNLEVDRPCLLLLRGGKLAVSDPENRPGDVKATVDGKTIDVKLPDGDLAGSSVVTDVAPAAGP